MDLKRSLAAVLTSGVLVIGGAAFGATSASADHAPGHVKVDCTINPSGSAEVGPGANGGTRVQGEVDPGTTC